MKDPKYGFHWIWIIPYYMFYNLYLIILQKWFPKKFDEEMK